MRVNSENETWVCLRFSSSRRRREKIQITLEFLMKILAAVKRVVDAKVKVRLLPESMFVLTPSSPAGGDRQSV